MIKYDKAIDEEYSRTGGNMKDWTLTGQRRVKGARYDHKFAPRSSGL